MDEYTNVIPVAVLIFFGSCISYMLRVDISIILLNITEVTNFSVKYCNRSLSPVEFRSANLRTLQFIPHEWKPLNPFIVATLLSMYNLGYSFSILLSEPFAEKIGLVRIVGYSTLMAAILTILSPLAYEAGVFVLVAARFLIGFLSGFVFPLFHILIVKWSPMNERNAFSLSLYGTSIGIIMTYPISAIIMKYLSWKWIAYILGTVAIFWALIWLFFVTDLPVQHSYISRHELQVIGFRRISLVTRRRRKHVPWKEIAKSKPIWALFILLWGNTWNLSFYIDYMPIYFYTVLGYELITASSLASIPVLARMICSWACLPLVRCIVYNNCFSSVGSTRKFFSFISHILPAVIQLSLLYVMQCHRLTNTMISIMFLGLNGAIIGGGSVNTIDLTPHFAANVYNAMQTLLCIAGICMPYVVAIVVLLYRNRIIGWIIILAVNAGVYLIGGIVFLIFGSGSVQEWDFENIMGVISHGYIAGSEEDFAY